MNFRKISERPLPPPPRPFFGKFHCDFFRKFITKIPVSNAKKIAMKFFGSEMTPPPFRKFSGNSFESGDTGFPYIYIIIIIVTPVWNVESETFSAALKIMVAGARVGQHCYPEH